MELYRWLIFLVLNKYADMLLLGLMQFTERFSFFAVE